jgi:fatty-acyl-CoA synthase
MSGKQNQYDVGLDRTQANFVPLTPLSFLARTAAVYPDQVSTVYEGRSFTWSETDARCRRFASYLADRGIGTGDTVAAMLPNIPAMNELHFAVPMVGAVLNALNIRLDAASIAFQLDHGGASIILVDPEFSGVIAEALTLMKGAKPFVIDVDDAAFGAGNRIGELEYEDALAQGDSGFATRPPRDEWPDQCAGCAPRQSRAARHWPDRRRGASGGRAGRRGRHRDQADPRLRTDRGLRPGVGLRGAAGLGRIAR